MFHYTASKNAAFIFCVPPLSVDFNQAFTLFILSRSQFSCVGFSCPLRPGWPPAAAHPPFFFLTFILVSRHASSVGWSCRLHTTWRWLGLGSGGWGLHLHWLLLCLSQIHHGVLQGHRGHLRFHTQSGVLDLLHHARCHVRWRWVYLLNE